ncbi:MAG: hypothetical protein ACRDGQ_03600, partial [Candidatus Limnocylindrales bacterium]
MSRRSNAPGPNAAVRAEPSGIGTAGARDPLAREVKLLGALLGQVIAEQAGEPLLARIEAIRARAKAGRSRQLTSTDATATTASTAPANAATDAATDAAIVPTDDRLPAIEDIESLDLATMEQIIRAFGLYFQVINVAEER